MADPTDPTITSLVGVGVNVGAFTLVGWLVKHTFNHTIPRLAEDFSKSLDTMAVTFTAALNQTRSDAKEERRELLAIIDKLRADVRRARCDNEDDREGR